MIETQIVEYFQGETCLKGLLVYDASLTSPAPAVILAPTWEGRGAAIEERAQQFATLGYVAFALDVYGEGKTGANPTENQQLMQPLIADRHLLQERLIAALTTVQNLEMVDVDRVAAIGYCFGGLCVLDLARSGANIKGVVSFHGLLSIPEISLPASFDAKVLVLHGHDDPMVPVDDVIAFETEMTEKKIDWQVHVYGHAMHGFTAPTANLPKLGVQYDAAADRRSWQAMSLFLEEVLG